MSVLTATAPAGARRGLIAFLATLGAILLAGPVLATLLRRRAPDMTMLRMPFFCWTALVTCLMVVLSFLLALPLAVGLHWVTTSSASIPAALDPCRKPIVLRDAVARLHVILYAATHGDRASQRRSQRAVLGR